jgi:hypothetical protein
MDAMIVYDMAQPTSKSSVNFQKVFPEAFHPSWAIDLGVSVSLRTVKGICMIRQAKVETTHVHFYSTAETQ